MYETGSEALLAGATLVTTGRRLALDPEPSVSGKPGIEDQKLSVSN